MLTTAGAVFFTSGAKDSWIAARSWGTRRCWAWAGAAASRAADTTATRAESIILIMALQGSRKDAPRRSGPSPRPQPFDLVMGGQDCNDHHAIAPKQLAPDERIGRSIGAIADAAPQAAPERRGPEPDDDCLL